MFINAGGVINNFFQDNKSHINKFNRFINK